MRADAIILAGGKASRMGGIDKPAIQIGGRTMLDAALSAVVGCQRTVVVGPHRADLGPEIAQTQEDPGGSGPVAAIGAGLRTLDVTAPFVVVLAADMPFLTATAVTELITRITASEADAAFAVDEAGRAQYLVGVWRTHFLVERLGSLGWLANLPMKALIPPNIETARIDGVSDCDTDEDVRRAVASLAPSRAVSLDEARNTLRTSLSPLPVRRATLFDSIGGTLATPLLAAAALPRFDISAMDGYAVAGAGPWRTRSEIGYAGGVRPALLRDGEAVRIATGAHLPDGATAVLRDEFADISTIDGGGQQLLRRDGTPVRDDVRRLGEDWQSGHTLAQPGSTITPALVSTAASAEVTEADVRGPVRAHVVVTGDEIRRDGPLREGQTRDSLGPVLPHFLSWCGIQVVSDAHLRDTPNGFDDLFAAAIDTDLILIVGATGGGAADQLRAALRRAGARLLVERVRCRPGGSQVTAELSDGRVVLGLPGNPYAALVTLLTMAPAVVDGLTTRVPRPPIRVPLANVDKISGDVTRIVPAYRLTDGQWIGVSEFRTAHLAGLIDHDGLAIVEPHSTTADSVELIAFPG